VKSQAGTNNDGDWVVTLRAHKEHTAALSVMPYHGKAKQPRQDSGCVRCKDCL